MKTLTVPSQPLTRSIETRPPGSKSLTNRALVMAALCRDDVTLRGALESEDTLLASQALGQLGCTIEKQDTTWTVRGQVAQGGPGEFAELYLGNSGTSVRFLSSMLCARGVPCRIDGTERMRRRPAELLIQALSELGGEITSEGRNHCPPLKIGGTGLNGGTIQISGKVSSQYFSGLMIAAPLAQNPVNIRVQDEFVSLPYIQMTGQVLRMFGIENTVDPAGLTIPAPQTYISPGVCTIEPDASSASYPLVLGMLHGVPVTIQGLGKNSLQGDLALVEHLAAMGAEVRMTADRTELFPPAPEARKSLGEVDLNAIPDAAMTLVTLAAATPGRSHLTGLANLAFKECDRLNALETELNKLGARVTAESDGFLIEGIAPTDLQPAQIATYQDHRMAMCLALLGTLCPGTVIEDPDCVEKTYPTFWQHLRDWMHLEPEPDTVSA